MRGPHSVVTTTFIPLTMVRLLSFRKILVAWRTMGEKLKRQTVERKKKKQQRQQKRRPNRVPAKCFPPVLERVDAMFGETTRSRAIDASASKIQTRWKTVREERRVRDELYHVWRSVSAARTIQEHWKSKREERYARLAREKEESRRMREGMAVSLIQTGWRDFKDVQDTMASLLLAAEMLAAEEERRVSRLRREAARTISEAYFRHRWVQI